MSDKIEVVISVTVKPPGYHYGKDKIEGEADAVYTLPARALNLPFPEIQTMIVAAYEDYKIKQAEAEAEADEQDAE